MSKWRHSRKILTQVEADEELRMLRRQNEIWLSDGNNSREVHRHIEGGRISAETSEHERTFYFRCRVASCSAVTKIVFRVKTFTTNEDDQFIIARRYYSTAGHTTHEDMTAAEMIAFDQGL